MVSAAGEQKRPRWRPVGARQIRNFLDESLRIEVHGERGGIGAKQLSNHGKLVGCRRGYGDVAHRFSGVD